MSTPIHKYSAESSSSRRWVLILLIILLAAAAAFAGFAFWYSNRGPGQGRSASGFTGPITPPPPQYSCPLDGTIVANKAAASQRPIVVQVDNAPAARNQAGLSQADIVYEAMAEGDITRFSAVYSCHEAAVIGPVRSARLINLELAPEYNALLVNSGSSEGVSAALDTSPDVININDNNFHDLAFWRTDDRAAPHNLMSSTAGIRKAADSVGITNVAKVQSLIFKDDKPAPAITNIEVNYSGLVDTVYRYDPATNGWLRFISGEPHLDAATGAQLTPKNVIIQFVPSYQSDIVEDVGGSHGMEYTLTGTGRAVIFRDGQAIDGMWTRPAKDVVTQYVDASGKPIELNRGLTFIQLVDTNFQPSWS